jgi:SM-20-related protein
MKKLINDMDSCGWAEMPGCLAELDSMVLRQECQDGCDAGAFRQAGVGRGAGLAIHPGIRGDQVLWLQPEVASPGQALYLAWLELLRLALNERFFLGLFDFEGHFAVYPEGTFYKAHLDRHANTSGRVVTAILYLNPAWQPGDGGELKLWTTSEGKAGAFVLIEPRMGTLVCFLAGDFWHEVLPAKKTRMSITGWFRQR